MDSDSEALCEKIATTLHNSLRNRFKLVEQTVLAAMTDLFNISAYSEELNKTFLDGLQFGLVLSATQPTTAGGLLEFIATHKSNDLEVQAYARIIAILYNKLQESQPMRDLR